MTLIAVFTTVDRAETAQLMARTLVERRLVACAQISAVESTYMWDGQLQQESEYRLMLKTIPARYAQVADAIRALHPYDLPAIHALATEHADPRYALWVEAQCAEDVVQGTRDSGQG